LRDKQRRDRASRSCRPARRRLVQERAQLSFRLFVGEAPLDPDQQFFVEDGKEALETTIFGM
jgi:hypothetical protein